MLKKIHFGKYEYQLTIHNLTVIALVIMLIHVLLTYSATASLTVRLAYIFYFSVGAAFYIYHKVIKKFLLAKNKFIVKDIVKESPNMWTIKLVPENGAVFSYKPGQFAFLKVLGNNVKKEEHPFSISSEPSNKEYISFTIKELGNYTSDIGKIQLGDKAIIDAPYGKFCYLNYPSEKETVLIAGGVGITPALSLLRYMRSQDKERNVILLWGINSRSDLICAEEFAEMQNEMKNFLLVPVVFRDDSWEGEKGIIDKEKIERILKKQGKDIHSKGYYICGPDIMLEKVTAALASLGVKRNRIHFEKFSL